ncbi:MAG: hypothetical protein HQL40_07030 [Alphaproteobacteria bacterium]|nr:hypothetical protein [Alphaproteobacteria bacterium]
MNCPDDEIERLQRLLDEIEEALIRSPRGELQAEEGPQAKRDAETARRIVADQLRAHGLRKREKVRREMEQARAARARRSRIPSEPTARRELLQSVMARRPSMVPQGLTMAFREGKEITDTEVDSILQALENLGALPSEEGQE